MIHILHVTLHNKKWISYIHNFFLPSVILWPLSMIISRILPALISSEKKKSVTLKLFVAFILYMIYACLHFTEVEQKAHIFSLVVYNLYIIRYWKERQLLGYIYEYPMCNMYSKGQWIEHLSISWTCSFHI